MPWAVFTRDFRFDRPKSKFCFDITASPEPQLKPRDIVAAAVAAGAAYLVESPRKAAQREADAAVKSE